MRITLNGKEYYIRFEYSRPKTGTKKDNDISTTCSVFAGPIGSRDHEKTLIGQRKVRRHSGDAPNFVWAREFSLSKALHTAKDLSEEEKNMLYTAMPIRRPGRLPGQSKSKAWDSSEASEVNEALNSREAVEIAAMLMELNLS